MSPATTQAGFDPTEAEAFAGRVLTALNDGALCLMLSVGHRTGLFDALSTLRQPATSEEIATHAGLHERYVREWLGAMVTAGVVEVDPATTPPQAARYVLPAEHAASLTRAVAADNLAMFAQYIAMLGAVEDDVVACFHQGGGVPYARFPRFHAMMAEESSLTVLSALESHILPLVPGLAERLAGGIQVLDVGCGRGRTVRRLGELYPHSTFVGLDLSEEAIAYAREEAARAGLTNISFVAADASDFDATAEPEAFDVITTFDAVHDQAQPLRVLRGIHRALKPDGVYLMQDIRAASHPHDNIAHPIGTLLYTVSCMHCMTVSLAQGGEGLGAMWGEETTRAYLQRAGFRTIETHRFAHDIQNNWYVIRK
jgi:ubiquinone/menaquinone biosynthesis C-methylase UbiE